VSGKPGRAPVLVAADDPGVRLALERALAEQWPILSGPLARLRDQARLVDAQSAVVRLPADAGLEVLEALEPLRDLPAGRAIVMLVAGNGPRWLDQALERLDPVQLLPDVTPPGLLRRAVERALPPGAGGEGARKAHRPARSLLGVSSAIRSVLSEIEQVAVSRVPVLILGETGTGKELVARALHEKSDRARAPFVAVNCGGLAETLLETELFGHERGAFTGAERSRAGLFEAAEGGTLFLDEVGEMSSTLQVKLLRAIETGEIRRVGGTRSTRVDARIVSATHRELDVEVESGRFRQDLLYRLNTVTLSVPPLRRRPVDIPFLAQHFAETFGAERARRITLDESFIDALSKHDFPGNVRELRNAVERAIALAAPGDLVSACHLPPGFAVPPERAPRADGPLRERVEQLEREAIREAEVACDGNRTRMAERLGLSRQGLRKKMRRLGLERPA
jgi:DNA-binding NtrC family response regulator